MRDYTYVIVGGGMTADAAVEGIRLADPAGPLAVIGAEPPAAPVGPGDLLSYAGRLPPPARPRGAAAPLRGRGRRVHRERGRGGVTAAGSRRRDAGARSWVGRAGLPGGFIALPRRLLS